MSEQRYRLVSDGDSRTYIIPAELSLEWVAYCQRLEDYMNGEEFTLYPELPSWADDVEGEAWSFTDPKRDIQ